MPQVPALHFCSQRPSAVISPLRLPVFQMSPAGKRKVQKTSDDFVCRAAPKDAHSRMSDVQAAGNGPFLFVSCHLLRCLCN